MIDRLKPHVWFYLQSIAYKSPLTAQHSPQNRTLTARNKKQESIMDFGTAAKAVGKGRWMVIWVSLLIMACSGGTYAFGLYSQSIKTALGYDQRTLQTLAFFKDMGGNFGLLSGLLNEVAPAWVVLAVGAVMNLAGFLLAWLAVTHRMAKPPHWRMYVYVCMGSTSQSFSNTGSLVTCVKNFPRSRGVVLGVLKGYVGLSGAIFTQIYHAVYGHSEGGDGSGMLLLLGVVPTAVSLAVMMVVRPTKVNKNQHTTELRRFYHFLYAALGLAAFLLVFIVVENQSSRFPVVAYRLVVAAIVLFFLLNLAVVVHAETQNLAATQTKLPAPDLALAVVQPTPTPKITAEPPAEAVVTSRAETCWGKLRRALRSPGRGEDHTIAQALVSLDMWILFGAMALGVGSTLTAMDNMGQIGAALGYTQQNITTLVALISIWNFLGRVAAGFVSELLLQRRGMARPLVLSAVLMAACVGHVLIAWGAAGSLYAASLIIGVCFGAQWPVMYAVISELFGLKYYATLYNVGTASSPVGFYLLSVRIAGAMYDREARRQGAGHTETGLTCVGRQCFRRSFLVMCGMCMAGSLVSLLLVARTRHFYRRRYLQLLQDADADADADTASTHTTTKIPTDTTTAAAPAAAL